MSSEIEQAENQNVRDITKDSVGRADQFEYATIRCAENQTSVRDVNQLQAARAGVNFDCQDKLEDNRNIRDMAKKGFQGDEQRKTLAATRNTESFGLCCPG